jgi:hypothetical protein
LSTSNPMKLLKLFSFVCQAFPAGLTGVPLRNSVTIQ